uniref:Uncharacterized protein n=1 Tax=Desertifilum tharense IPPAS B-1220 TaxID=1781255 RepID=A0ACD5GW95_9CYAN
MNCSKDETHSVLTQHSALSTQHSAFSTLLLFAVNYQLCYECLSLDLVG